MTNIPGNELNDTRRAQPDCSAIVDLIPAYSLGASDPDERTLVDANLWRCPEAVTALAKYAALTERLHYAVPLHEAPPLLATKLIDRIKAVPAVTVPPRTYRSSRLDALRRLWRRPTIAVAALLCLLFVSNGYWLTYIQRLSASQNQLAETVAAQTALLAALGTGKTQQVVLLPPGMSGPDNFSPLALLVCDPHETVGLLHVSHFPVSADGTWYQLSFWKDQQPVEIVRFQVTSEGTADAIFRAPQDIVTYVRADIDQGAGGGHSPATRPLVSGELYPQVPGGP